MHCMLWCLRYIVNVLYILVIFWEKKNKYSHWTWFCVALQDHYPLFSSHMDELMLWERKGVGVCCRWGPRRVIGQITQIMFVVFSLSVLQNLLYPVPEKMLKEAMTPWAIQLIFGIVFRAKKKLICAVSMTPT